MNVLALLDEAAKLGQSGQLEAAQTRCEQVLAFEPQHARALQLMGLIKLQRQHFSEALHFFERAFQQNASAEVADQLGVVYGLLKQPEASLNWFQKALEILPDYHIARLNFITACMRTGQDHLAWKEAEYLLNIQPQRYPLRLKLAQSYSRWGRPQQAIEHFKIYLAAYPQEAEIWGLLGMAHRALGHSGPAIQAYQTALNLDAETLIALVNLGVMYQEAGHLNQAKNLYERAYALTPDASQVLINLGNVYEALEGPEHALPYFQRLLAAQPNHLQALDGVLRLKIQLCDWQDWDVLIQRLYAQIARGTALDQIAPYTSLLLPLNAEQQYQIARAHAQVAQSKVQHLKAYSSQDYRSKPAASKLRIGYLSADFREHILGEMIGQLFSGHNRERFEIFTYYTDRTWDAYSAQFEAESDVFRRLCEMDAQEAAATIFQDQVDILVFLGGYSEGDKPEILALRPAPVQLTYLDYPATMGASWIDYILTDAVLTPEWMAPWFSETFVYLPDSYQLNNDQLTYPTSLQARAHHGLPESGFVFSCFNKATRIDPTVFACWMRILNRVPESVLWLYAQNSSMSEQLCNRAREAGIAPKRLIFAPRLSKQAHIHRQGCADLFLDTLNTNAHTTATDALGMGVPLLTLPGKTMTARVGASLLSALKLPELMASDLRHYEEIAVDLALTPTKMAALKNRLKKNKSNHPLFTSAAKIRSIERAYEMIWKHYITEKPPEIIYV